MVLIIFLKYTELNFKYVTFVNDCAIPTQQRTDLFWQQLKLLWRII